MTTPTADEFEPFECRIRLDHYTTAPEGDRKIVTSTAYRYLRVEDFSFSSDSMAKKFNPMMMRILSETLFDGNSFPTLLVFFGQWVEGFTLKCTAAGTPIQIADYLSDLRVWLLRNTNKETVFYLQMMREDATGITHLSAREHPLYMGSTTQGFRVMPVGLPSWSSWKAGKGEMTFTLKFACALVLP